MDKEIKFDYNTGKIERRYTTEWRDSGFIRTDKIPDMVKAVVVQHGEMIEYIQSLHDKIDEIMDKCNICPICIIPNCTSDHK